MNNHLNLQITPPKQEFNSPVPSYKSTHTSQSSLLDSPIAQLLGFGTSSSQNINFPPLPSPINNNQNLTGNIASSSPAVYFNSQPTFSETKDSNDNKLDENKNFSNRLHNFQPPPLLLPNQKILKPDFIESPRTNDQEDDFIGDFEYYPGESASFNFKLNSLENSINDSNTFRYSNVNSSPSPKTSTFERSYATVNIDNKIQNNFNDNEKTVINQSNSSSPFTKSGINRTSNKNLINLNLVTSSKLKPYMSSPFAVQNTVSSPCSTFVNTGNSNAGKLDTKSIVFNDITTPSPKTPSFIFDTNIEGDDVDANTHKSEEMLDSPISDIIKNESTSFISDSRNNNGNNAPGLKSLFTNASRSMLKLENDISSLKSALTEVHDRYARKYKDEKEKYRKDIISMIERHREELKSISEIDDDIQFNYNRPIIHVTSKRSSRTRNKNRNSNRRIRHDDLYDDTCDSHSSFTQKNANKQYKQTNIDADIIKLGTNTTKVLKCIGSSPPSVNRKESHFFTSPLKISRISGHPMLHSQPESILHVRVHIPNKKDLLINDPKIKSLLMRQREEIISLNEESSSRLASISEEAANAEKQINDRITELSAAKSNKNNLTLVANSDASSSSSSAPSVFYIDDSDGPKDEFSMLSTITPTNSPNLPSKYSSSSSSLSTSSFSSSNSKMKQAQEPVSNNNQKKNKQSLIPLGGKTRNAPQRLLRHYSTTNST